MPSRRFAAKYGAIRFLSCPGRAETVSKFRAVSGNAWRTPSPSPPKSAKVKLMGSASFNAKRRSECQAAHRDALRETKVLGEVAELYRFNQAQSHSDVILLSPNNVVGSHC